LPAARRYAALFLSQAESVIVAKQRGLGDIKRERKTHMESVKRGDSEKALNDLGAAVREGEEMLDATAGEVGERGRALRAKLEGAVDKAKVLYDRLQDKTVAAARAADQTVRDHPYQAVGIAFGIGLLIGVLAARTRRD
jgi:ElaB/YqjD/DUF883 family membrane-anchored ribosome-binding protein